MKKLFKNNWDENFFRRFMEVRDRLYKNHPDFVPESLTELELFFAPTAFFGQTMRWLAVMLEHEGEIRARYLLSMHPDSEVLYLGYFECNHQADENAVREHLLSDIEAFRRQFPEVRSVRGPIQGTIFGGARFRAPSDHARFLGESLHLEHYPDLWTRWGFVRDQYFDSFAFGVTEGQDFYQGVYKKLERFWQDPQISCRDLTASHWEEEIQDIYEITMDAYAFRGTNDEIDDKTFRALAKRMRPLTASDSVKLLEYRQKVVGFCICYRDIQKEIRAFNLRKKNWPRFINKLCLYAAMLIKRHPLMMVYVAKAQDCPVKWAMARLATSMIDDVSEEKYSGVISAFNAEDSGSRASLPTKKIQLSRHFLMSLSLVTPSSLGTTT